MSAPTVQTNPLPPAPSAVDLLDNTRPSLISQAWNQWLLQAQQKINVINETLAILSSGSVTPGGALGVSSGGTGATTASVAFGNLSPLTTSGDMLIYNGGNIRLPISTNGFVLQIVAGIPTWVNPSAGSSPLTTKGDLYGYSTAPARIPVGSDTYVLTADSTNTLGVSWKPAGTPTLPVTTKGDILGYSTLPARIPVGTDGQLLLADSTQALGVRWGPAGSSSPLTTKGDLYGYSNTDVRVPVGNDGQVLTSDSTNVNGISWKNLSGIISYVKTTDTVGMSTADTTIPSNNSIPQITQGAAYTALNTSITPKVATSVLEIEIFIPFISSQTSGQTPKFAVFRDSTINAVFSSFAPSILNTNVAVPVYFKFFVPSNSTTSTTFSIRWSTGSGTSYILQVAGSSYFGGTSIASMSIKELS